MHTDACSLPHPDDRFDGAYIITTLGQVRDQVGALRELRRVLKPSDRLVVGDFLGDPDVVTFRRLCARATQADCVSSSVSVVRWATSLGSRWREPVSGRQPKRFASNRRSARAVGEALRRLDFQDL